MPPKDATTVSIRNARGLGVETSVGTTSASAPSARHSSATSSRLSRVARGQGEPRALRGQGQGQRAADARRGAGQDDRLAGVGADIGLVRLRGDGGL